MASSTEERPPMLEPPTLLLRPWQRTLRKRLSDGALPPAATSGRTVLDAHTGSELGWAYQEVGSQSNWRRWLGQPVVGVYETADESLLMTLHRTWSVPPGWEVRDADGNTVGTFQGVVVHNAFGQLVAWFEPEATEAAGRIVAPDGTDLGTVWRCQEGTRLAFDDRVNENPYYKMVLLGAVLAKEG